MEAGWSRRYRAVRFWIIAILAASVCLGAAQASGATRKTAKPKQLLTRFDPNASSLPPGYEGTDPKQTVLSLMVAPKQELETTEEYERRLSAVPPATFAFQAPIRTSYDADTELLGVGVPIETSAIWVLRQSLYSAGMELHASDIARGSYVGTNAFGVKTKVSRYDRTEMVLAFPKRSSSWNSPYVFILRMKRDDVPNARRDLRVVVTAKLSAESVVWPERFQKDTPCVLATEYDVASATIDSPVEVRTCRYIVQSRNVDLILYNRRTGAILDRAILSAPELPPSSDIASAVRFEGSLPLSPLEGPTAQYTAVARRMKLTGEVVLDVTVGVDGRATSATVVKPLRFGLDESAVDAILQWKFQPPQAPSTIRLTVRFSPEAGGGIVVR
jgi:TonB family protein